MHLINLEIDRIIIHQIYQRDMDGKTVKPFQSSEYTRFDESAMSAFKSRVVDALGEGSKAVQMEIVAQDEGKLPRYVDRIIGFKEAEFATASYEIAKKLADAQSTRSIPGGIVVIFTGRQGHPKKRFLGIIKAEVHSAYEKQENPETKEISLKFVEEVLLTPGTKLYKTAAFFEKQSVAEESEEDLNNKWTVMVSDYQISQTDGKAAAKYFYADFLGFGYPETSARTTKKFFDATKKFISSLDIPETEKVDLHSALITYLKVDVSSTVAATEFAERYFELDTQDAFTVYIEEQGLPVTSFMKDNSHIEAKLKVRSIRFPSKVKLVAPSDVFTSRIDIEEIDGDKDEAGTKGKWTKIIIKDRIATQE